MLANIVSIRDWNDVTKRDSFASMEESAMMRTRKSATHAFVSIVLLKSGRPSMNDVAQMSF